LTKETLRELIALNKIKISKTRNIKSNLKISKLIRALILNYKRVSSIPTLGKGLQRKMKISKFKFQTPINQIFINRIKKIKKRLQDPSFKKIMMGHLIIFQRHFSSQ
jgi:hypothetical protein